MILATFISETIVGLRKGDVNILGIQGNSVKVLIIDVVSGISTTQITIKLLTEFRPALRGGLLVLQHQGPIKGPVAGLQKVLPCGFAMCKTERGRHS